jgi:hypothetical protein
MIPREFVDKELKIVNFMFNQLKEISPMFVLCKNDDRFQIPARFNSQVHKEIILQGIKDLVKKSEPDIVVFMAEAWVTIVKEGLDGTVIPGSVQNRVEILMVAIEFKTGEKYGCEAKIIREENKPPRLEQFEVYDSRLSMGNFCDFFPAKRLN